jgi:hypothetical protein
VINGVSSQVIASVARSDIMEEVSGIMANNTDTDMSGKTSFWANYALLQCLLGDGVIKSLQQSDRLGHRRTVLGGERDYFSKCVSVCLHMKMIVSLRKR